MKNKAEHESKSVEGLTFKGTDPEANNAECDPADGCEVHDVPVPPDGGWGWVIVLSSFICNLIVDGIAYTFGVFLPTFSVYFDEGKGTVAWVGSLLAGVYLACGPIVSALTNKFGCRTTCIIGSVVGSLAFILSTFSNSVVMLMVTYGIIGGIGFGLIYLPAIVSVGYYFEKKRAFATGIAVCGSGFGTFVFAPLADMLLANFDWKGANLILGGLILNCAVFGALMRPLPPPPKKTCKPLLQRMAEDKAMQMERGSLSGSTHFMVQLPDGSYEKRLKVPVNVDPGVHSSLNLDEAPGSQASTMPTINETKSLEAPLAEAVDTRDIDVAKEEKQQKNAQLKENLEERTHEADESEKLIEDQKTVSAIRGSHASVSNGDASNVKRRSGGASVGSKEELENISASRTTLTKASSRKDLSRPMVRDDVLYTGSVTNLREFKSQKSVASYRQSIVSLKAARGLKEQPATDNQGCCSCLPESVTSLMDFSLMKDPVFLFIGVANIFGMLGFYVPFVYIIDAAELKGIEGASFLLSIIGITNTVGRVISGWISDFPFVDSLLVTNICILVSGLSVFCVPFCHDYLSFCIACVFFGLFSSAFIALTSIVLVDLLGIAQLTNAFGLLCLLRGVAAIAGPPLAGSVYDMTQSYDVPFWLAGIFLFVSAAISFTVPCVRRFTKRRQQKQDKSNEGELRELKSHEEDRSKTKPVKV